MVKPSSKTTSDHLPMNGISADIGDHASEKDNDLKRIFSPVQVATRIGNMSGRSQFHNSYVGTIRAW
jgi:hypothetical protein